MTTPDLLLYASITASLLGTVAILAMAGLKAWSGWLALKRIELERFVTPRHGPEAGESQPLSAATRIEMADLKERIRKLEAIAAGVDL